MSTVLKARAAHEPGVRHDLVFTQDRGGRATFAGLPNVDLRVVHKGRIAAFVQYALTNVPYADVSVTSLPDLASTVAGRTDVPVFYEFHTSTREIISTELAALDIDRLAGVRVPSEYLADMVRGQLPHRHRGAVMVVPNLVDTATFRPDGAAMPVCGPGQRPLVWVGRFDKGKNFRDFLRLMSLLPTEFVGVVVVSLEHDPDRMAQFLSEVAYFRLEDRVSLHMNLDQARMAAVYRAAARAGGTFCSTSLAESFGYGVLEAMHCGLPAVAYAVGALSEHRTAGGELKLVDVGDLDALADAIRSVTDGAGHLPYALATASSSS
ncbi:glycosyltransferase family 4 protein [Georgenia sp. SUBG003]|uniref:glycosyltransferase family 4 protein n=1 Tax=Georgenia sp. SUBG003 TaxID=1497974 RepID=UPI0004D38CC2|nr:hypothetical protein DA06_02570 [Georgenia sp. SUBG003]